MANKDSNNAKPAATDATSVKAEGTAPEQAVQPEQAQGTAEQPAAEQAAPASESNEPPASDTPPAEEPAPVAEEVKELIEEKPEDVTAQLRKEYPLPEAWTDEQVLAWFETVASLPAGTDVSKDGVFFNDPTRQYRQPHEWPTEELLLALKGELDITDNKLNAVVKEYRQRESLDAAWTFRQVLEYFRDAIVPPKTSNGVWVTDVTRVDRPVSAWSTAELEAWAKGEITSAGKNTDPKLALELKNRLSLNAKSNSPADVIAAYNAATNASAPESEAPITPATNKSAGTSTTPGKGLTAVNQSFIDATIERYETLTALGRAISPEDGANEETKLETMFQYVIGLPPEGMVTGLNQIRDWVKKNRDGLFHADHAHRFSNLMRKDIKERHMNFIEALRIYLDPNKEVRKQSDLRYLLSKQPEDKQEMLVEWFTKYI